MVSESVVGLLDRLDGLDRELTAVRAAPAPVEQQINQLRSELDAAAAAFRIQPWVPHLGLRAALAAICPKPLRAFEEGLLPERAEADQRQPFSAAERHDRTASIAAEITGLLGRLGPADLSALEREAGRLHALLRGLQTRRDELAAKVDRRTAAIAIMAEEREIVRSGTPSAPARWPGFDAEGRPDLWPAPAPTPLSASEIRARDAALSDLAAAEEKDLSADREALAEAEAAHTAAAAAWRAAAQAVERCRAWLRRKSTAPARMPIAAE